MCHICGRQTLIAGYAHHIDGCSKKFLARESQKPVKERRPLPVNPYESMGTGKKSSKEMEELSQQAYNATLSDCAFCGRRFLPEKLIIHNRSCRADKPARGVRDSVNRCQENSRQQHEQLITSSSNHHSNTRPKSARRVSADKGVQQFQNIQPAQFNDVYSDTSSMVPAEWTKCQGCGRTFTETAYAKHSKICDKIFCSKRPTFNSKKHRIMGTEAAQFANKSKKGDRGRVGGGKAGNMVSDTASGGLPKWKAQSSQLRQAMKAARQVSKAQKVAESRGVPLASVLPPGGGGAVVSYEDPSFIRCPHCSRTYNEEVRFFVNIFVKCLSS